MEENKKTNTAIVRFSSGRGNQMEIKFPEVVKKKEKCSCSISKPAESFKELVELVKQAEEILIKNGYNEMEDRISIIRGIYYGTEWSLDYNVEKSKSRNLAFNYAYVQNTVTADAREALKCCSNCNANF